MKIEEIIVIFVFLGVVIISYVIVYFIIKPYKKNIDYQKYNPNKTSSSKNQTVCSAKEKYIRGTSNNFLGDFFFIHNHLNKNIKIYITNEQGKKIHLVTIDSKSNIGLNQETAEQAFINKNNISVFTLENGLTPAKPKKEIFFGDYKLKIPNDTSLKNFHIGLVTSKSIGSHYDETVTPGANAIQGRSKIYIHNLTNHLLRLNHNIIIPPNNKIVYHGEYFFGVALGTVFKDQDGYFNDFIYKVPATDIIYGITSDSFYPNYSGFDLDEKDLLNIPHEPNFLLEEGFLGGPAVGDIDPNFIPTEGFPIAPIDRFGRVIKDREKIKDWVYSNNRKPLIEEKNFFIL